MPPRRSSLVRPRPFDPNLKWSDQAATNDLIIQDLWSIAGVDPATRLQNFVAQGTFQNQRQGRTVRNVELELNGRLHWFGNSITIASVFADEVVRLVLVLDTQTQGNTFDPLDPWTDPGTLVPQWIWQSEPAKAQRYVILYDKVWNAPSRVPSVMKSGISGDVEDTAVEGSATFLINTVAQDVADGGLHGEIVDPLIGAVCHEDTASIVGAESGGFIGDHDHHRGGPTTPHADWQMNHIYNDLDISSVNIQAGTKKVDLTQDLTVAHLDRHFLPNAYTPFNIRIPLSLMKTQYSAPGGDTSAITDNSIHFIAIAENRNHIGISYTSRLWFYSG